MNIREAKIGVDDDGQYHILDKEENDWLPLSLGGGVSSGGLKTVVVSDSTGYTFFGNPGGSLNPMPRTSYTVDRDDLNAVADPTVDPILSAGIYMAGGYIDWVPDGTVPSPTGPIAAWIDAISGGLKPEGDEGPDDLSVDISETENQIVAYPRVFQVPEGTDCMMRCRFDSSDKFTVVRWVFWIAQLVDLSV